jgi:hypothetical protein
MGIPLQPVVDTPVINSAWDISRRVGVCKVADNTSEEVREPLSLGSAFLERETYDFRDFPPVNGLLTLLESNLAVEILLPVPKPCFSAGAAGLLDAIITGCWRQCEG